MNQPLPPPGWYPDAANAALVRWWDGVRWTDATQPSGTQVPAAGMPSSGATTSPRAKRVWPKVLGIVGAVVIGVPLLAAIGPAVTGESPTPSNSPTPPANFDESSFPTCSSLVPDMVKFINKDRPDTIQVMDIYQPRMVSTHLKAYLAGTYKIPAGQVDVTLLTCSGTARLANEITVPVAYTVDVDLKGNLAEGYDRSVL